MKTIQILIIVIVVACCSIFLFVVFQNFFPVDSEFDVVNKKNDKIIKMMNNEIEQQIDRTTRSSMYPGFINESKENTVAFLKTIKSIETYTRFGVTSTRAKNYLQIKIEFNNGKIVDNIYTGNTCSGFMETCLLLKIEMKNGLATQVFTNGLEKKGSPEWIKNDLNLIIKSVISYEIVLHHDNYFPPSKTQKDFDKEWENQ